MGFFSGIANAVRSVGRGTKGFFSSPWTMGLVGGLLLGAPGLLLGAAAGNRLKHNAEGRMRDEANNAAIGQARSQEQAGMLAYGQELKRLRAKRGFASTMLSGGGSLGGGTAGGKTSLG